jgi:hypothetical protein
MSAAKVDNALVSALVAAINGHDRPGFLALLSMDAILTDDGTECDLHEWIDREIFASNGQMQVRSVSDGGLRLVARFRNDARGEMRTRWRFEIDDDKISRIETGQA